MTVRKVGFEGGGRGGERGCQEMHARGRLAEVNPLSDLAESSLRLFSGLLEAFLKGLWACSQAFYVF